MKVKTYQFFIILSCFSIPFSKCAQQNDEYPIKTEIIDGIKVVINPDYPCDDVVTLELEEDLSIGDGTGENYLFDSPGEVRVGED